MSKHDKGRLSPFVPLLKDTLASPAWRAMSHGAKVLYVSLKARYNSGHHNNGRIFLSQRGAAREVGSGYNEIARWFRELQHYGFIVQTKGGCLGLDGKGKAPHWRLTECGYTRDLPTRDFLKWDGKAFKDDIRPRQKKQNPVTESHNTLLRKSITPVLRKSITPSGTSVTESRNISKHGTVTENRNISSIPLVRPAEGLLPWSALVLTDIFSKPSSAEIERAHFSAKNRRGKSKDWDVRRRVLDLLDDGSTRTVKEIMAGAGVRNRRAADMLLHKLVNDGIVERAERGIYRLARNGEVH